MKIVSNIDSFLTNRNFFMLFNIFFTLDLIQEMQRGWQNILPTSLLYPVLKNYFMNSSWPLVYQNVQVRTPFLALQIWPHKASLIQEFLNTVHFEV